MVKTRGGRQSIASAREAPSTSSLGGPSTGGLEGGDVAYRFIQFEGGSFINEEAVDFYQKSSNKSISGGKWCNLLAFRHGFEFITENFSALGWSKLLGISNIYYEKLVIEFYANMKESGGVVNTFVKGRPISFDSKWINELLECPNEGSDHFAPTKWSPIIDKSDLNEFFPNLDGVGLGLHNLDMTYFTPTHRVLYHLITSSLAPTQGHKTDISHVSLHLFYGIMRKIPINYGAFFIKYLLFCKSKTQHGLCFGRIITRIFEKCNFSFIHDVSTAPTGFDIVDDDCFRRMHMIDIGNRWMYKKSKLRHFGVNVMSHIGDYIYDDIVRGHRGSGSQGGDFADGPSGGEGLREQFAEAGPSSGHGLTRTDDGLMAVLLQLQSDVRNIDRNMMMMKNTMDKMNKRIDTCDAKMDHMMTKKQATI